MMSWTSPNTLLGRVSPTGAVQDEMTRDALLLWMIPCGITVQVFFCSSKSAVGSFTTFLSGISGRFESVFYSLKEAKEEYQNISTNEG
jgi:hypothetical protein